jgi:hypothetical protein
LIPINPPAAMAIDGLSAPADALPTSCALYKLSSSLAHSPFAPAHTRTSPSSRLRHRRQAFRHRAIVGAQSSSPDRSRTKPHTCLLPWSAARSSLRRLDLPQRRFSTTRAFTQSLPVW